MQGKIYSWLSKDRCPVSFSAGSKFCSKNLRNQQKQGKTVFSSGKIGNTFVGSDTGADTTVVRISRGPRPPPGVPCAFAEGPAGLVVQFNPRCGPHRPWAKMKALAHLKQNQTSTQRQDHPRQGLVLKIFC